VETTCGSDTRIGKPTLLVIAITQARALSVQQQQQQQQQQLLHHRGNMRLPVDWLPFIQLPIRF